MFSSISIANKLIEIAESDGKFLTPMKLLKLAYICHGWMLALHDRPLIFDEIHAWKYGPIIPKLYQKIQKHRNDPI